MMTALSVWDGQNLFEVGDATFFRRPPLTRDQTPLRVAFPTHAHLPHLREKSARFALCSSALTIIAP